MKDLYRKLELEPTATRDEIVAALEQQPELEAYSAILLDDEKRSQYDQVHRALKMIATLRFRLDLDKNDTWFIQRYPDFAIMPKPKLSEAPREPSAAPKSRDKRKRRGDTRAGWLLPLLILLIVVAAIGLMLIL
jgi:hypothetical protein